MSTKTSNFEYIKPGEDEFYNITEFNQTLDKIDADMKALKDTEVNHTDNATVHVTAEDKESWNTSLENKTLTYTESSTIQDLNSGEKLSIAFGKLKKAVNAVKNHTGTKATTSVQGHVKLSNSSAVTDSTGLALPVTEKNASISGTLAYMLANFSGKLNLIWYNTGSNFTTDDDATALNGYRITAPEEYMMFLIYSTAGNVSVLGNWDNCVSYLNQFLNVYSDNEYATAIAYRKVTLEIAHVSSGGYFKNIVFDKAYYKGVAANSSTKPYNGSCIPLRIYGIRK
ncbi:hypothetical protein WMO43_02485 [Lachnospiraceae bacterium CLA-AA-H185]|uniref:Uncharacterized protein n=1 Tax=Maccoyibacter intestinihominis TaxID=3133499 RepID=A0ABV1HBY5_9FIRM